MADELDKFVLQYSVELKDSITRLERLNDRVVKVNKQASKTKEELKVFASGAADEIGKLVPGVDKVSAAVRTMGAQFALAGTAVAALAIGVKAVMNLRERYQDQRLAGQELGVSAIRVEEYQRKFATQSGGRVTREQALSEVGNFGNQMRAAYTDPTRMGETARAFSAIGVNVGERGKESTSVNDGLVQLATRFQSMRPDQIAAAAKSIGMSQDFAMTLAKIGPDIGKVSQQTFNDVQRSAGAQKNMDKFNDSWAKMSEEFTRAETILAEKLLPSFTKLIDLMAKLAEKLPQGMKETAKSSEDASKKAQNFFMDAVKDIAQPDKQSKFGMAESLWNFFTKPLRELEQKRLVKREQNTSAGGKVISAKEAEMQKTADTANDNAKAAETNVQAASKQSKSVDEFVDAADRAANEGRQTTDKLILAANMFNGAVHAFANAVDERQAIAAWAGEVGRAAGLPGASEASDRTQATGISPQAGREGGAGQGAVVYGSGQVAPFDKKTAYDGLFNEAAAKYAKDGITADLLKRVAKVESGFESKAVSEVGAEGLMQLMPSIQKKYGITDGFDPRQNIMGGARLLAENMKRSNGDVTRALLMYHGGLNEANWGVKTRAYPAKVLGQGGVSVPVTAPVAAVSQASVLGSPEAPKPNGPVHTGEPVFKYRQTRGESRETIQRDQVYANIAGRLGVPLQQLRLGGVNRDDAAWAAAQAQAGIQNNIASINKELQNVALPQQIRSKLITDLREQQSGLQMMRQYSGEVIDRQKVGERSITIGENAIVINVTESGNPTRTAETIFHELRGGIKDIVNQSNDGLKY